MRSRRARGRGVRWTLAALLALAAVLAISACGGGEEDDGGGTPAPPPARSEDFPDPSGKTLGELRESLGAGPVLAPSVSLLEGGGGRFGFGLFDRSRKQIGDAQVALYAAPISDEEARSGEARGGKVSGPFVARAESLAVKPEFQSESVTSDPESAQSFYVSDLELEKPGKYALLGAVRLDDRVVATDPVAIEVVRDGKVPEVGERPPKINTPTVQDVGGQVSQIDTRVPPAPDLHEHDFADVAGERPVVLLFATPALCVSRVCGPVVDIAKQVKAERGEEAAWIHMEIYNDNELDKGFRPQVLRWNLPTEPWVFTLDREGRVAARLEGAFSARELERALDAAMR